MNATLQCKCNTQRILSPGDLNWVQHWVSRIGLSLLKLLAVNKATLSFHYLCIICLQMLFIIIDPWERIITVLRLVFNSNLLRFTCTKYVLKLGPFNNHPLPRRPYAESYSLRMKKDQKYQHSTPHPPAPLETAHFPHPHPQTQKKKRILSHTSHKLPLKSLRRKYHLWGWRSAKMDRD